MTCVSEYTLPVLPSKPPSIIPSSEKKTQVIKSLPTSKPTMPVRIQKPISVFLTPKKSNSSLASRKNGLLDRIRAKASQQPTAKMSKEQAAAWDRGEWAIGSLFM